MQYNQNSNRYNIQIVDNNNAQESVIEKAKKFIANNKGKLAALAGLAALGSAGYYMYNNNVNNETVNTDNSLTNLTKNIPKSPFPKDIVISNDTDTTRETVDLDNNVNNSNKTITSAKAISVFTQHKDNLYINKPITDVVKNFHLNLNDIINTNTAHVKLPEHEIPGLDNKPITVTTVDGRTVTIPGKLDDMLNQVNMPAKEYFKQFNNNH